MRCSTSERPLWDATLDLEESSSSSIIIIGIGTAISKSAAQRLERIHDVGLNELRVTNYEFDPETRTVLKTIYR